MNMFYLDLGIKTNNTTRKIYFNSPNNFLIERAVATGGGHLSKTGALVVKTGKHTGRSAKDKYVVKTPATQKDIWWENDLNAMTPETFQKLKETTLKYLNQDQDLYITENSVGASPEHNIGVRLISTHPSHALFSNYLFRTPLAELDSNSFTILHAPTMKINAADYDAKSETIVTTCFETKTTIIVGTLYAGEIKKSMFSIMNYVLPAKNLLPMHSGCNKLENEEVSIFFGLSGTGKTTLSTDEGTFLIGDDEHALHDNGVFNFEGGCYAKTYKLSEETEPDIYNASNRFGSLLENVVLNEKTGKIDFFDKTLSENGRSSYPLDFIDSFEKTSQGGIPKHIFFLTADAFGVLPPVSKLTKAQAMFYFVLGYTAKLAGTEIGVKEPQATFSPCFGAPFMLRHPSVYAELLGHYLDKFNTDVWLINTGWTGGAYGVGQRFPLHITRKIIRAIQNNQLATAEFEKDAIFGLQIPTQLDKVPSSLIFPEKSWESTEKYHQQATALATSFHKQMQKFGDFYNKHAKAGGPTYS